MQQGRMEAEQGWLEWPGRQREARKGGGGGGDVTGFASAGQVKRKVTELSVATHHLACRATSSASPTFSAASPAAWLTEGVCRQIYSATSAD